MKIKIMPDAAKSKALAEMAKITIARIKDTDKNKYPANVLTDYYDVLHKLMEALILIEGVKFKGDGAHWELIDYISKKYGLGESNRVFLQELRDDRNRVSYEGLKMSEEYIDARTEKIEKLIAKLLDLLKQ